MKKLFSLLLFAALAALPSISHAQDLELKDDTIKVSPSAFPLVTFMGEIRDYQALCDDYKIKSTTTTLTIRPNVSKPVNCRLVVTEGSKNSPRQHQFVLVFDKNADPSEQMHDYSTKELLEQRIAYLEKSRNGGGGDDASDDQSSKKSKKKKDREKEDTPDVSKDLTKLKGKAKEKQDAAAETVDAPKEKVKSKGKSKKDSSSGDETSDAGHEKKSSYTTTGSSQQAGSDAGTSSGTSGHNDIKSIPQELLEQRVKLKVNAFYQACSWLCEKRDIANTITYGMKLFDNDEDALVETTNSKTNVKSSKKIRQYFNHLSLLSYKKVEMTASDIKFVSNFQLRPDGKYHGSAVVIQDFRGFKDGIQVYEDQTNKTIDIIVNTYEQEKDGKTVTLFDIFLGNISVTNVPSN